MTINELMNVLENNYEEIDVFDHINTWTEEIAIGYLSYAMCTYYNREHKLAIQFMEPNPTDENSDIQNLPIYQICISYVEDENNKIQKAFRNTKNVENKVELYYEDIMSIASDMGWLPIVDAEEV